VENNNEWTVNSKQELTVRNGKFVVVNFSRHFPTVSSHLGDKQDFFKIGLGDIFRVRVRVNIEFRNRYFCRPFDYWPVGWSRIRLSLNTTLLDTSVKALHV